jgi:hypothetical protein
LLGAAASIGINEDERDPQLDNGPIRFFPDQNLLSREFPNLKMTQDQVFAKRKKKSQDHVHVRVLIKYVSREKNMHASSANITSISFS